jgi:hypothetical protein
MRAHPSNGSAGSVDPSGGSLDEFGAETAPGRQLLDVRPAGLPSSSPPKFLSRVESRQARRRNSRLTRLAMSVRDRLVKKDITMPKVTAFDAESHGVIIATLLSIVALTYGSFLTTAWRHPVEARAASAPAISSPAVSSAPAVPPAIAPAVALEVAPVVAPVVNVVPSQPPVTAAPSPVEPEPVVARRRRPGGVSARTLTALWEQRDTRSLDQAFTGLRRQTLAFHRCGMRKTADDQAVANCEGAGSTWTIDFQRSAGRWQIANVATR